MPPLPTAFDDATDASVQPRTTYMSSSYHTHTAAQSLGLSQYNSSIIIYYRVRVVARIWRSIHLDLRAPRQSKFYAGRCFRFVSGSWDAST